MTALAAAVLGGCGGAKPAPTDAPPATPRAERVREQAGAIVVRGDVGPDQFGPLALRGTYRVTFAQQGAGVDFAREVPFTAHLEQDRGGGDAPRRRALFQRAARTGATTVTADGRWTLLVDFGDSPFTVTLTPK
jgi:hypothetical protein